MNGGIKKWFGGRIVSNMALDIHGSIILKWILWI
jgi:hypothetical protein